MVNFTKKKTTTIFLRNSQRDLSPVPQRELKKRKNVRFEDEEKTSAVATSDFVTQANRQWTFVATCFGLPYEPRPVHRDGDDELFDLCENLDRDESIENIDDGSDNSVPFAIFAEQGMRITWQPRTTSSTVSTLCLSSMLRIDSRVKVTTPFKENQNHLQPSFLNDRNEMEQAFQGVLPCSNAQKAVIMKHPSKIDKICSEDFEEESFWEIVEF